MIFRKGGSWLIVQFKGSKKCKFEAEQDLNTLLVFIYGLLNLKTKILTEKYYMWVKPVSTQNPNETTRRTFKGPEAGGSISGRIRKNILFMLLKEKKHKVVVYFTRLTVTSV